ncbi:hypothetical protein PoB_003613300 [Plakobranchus ocellatus]|uniref:EGF-like domain-containing protein n=1 Tax=Plakobranchus ocellatus TaxID=259542 RepID=A0AAV4ASS1_9GAST|nr:hypothetical protein PoB_003613300 [Plakobranchus ocellatus]
MSKRPAARMRISCRLLSHHISLIFCFLSMFSVYSAEMIYNSIFDTDTNGNFTCGHLDCQNSNPCIRSVINSSQSSAKSEGSARCLCRGKWAGSRCQLELRLSLSTISSRGAVMTLRGAVPFAASASSSSFSDFEILHLEEFTIFLWPLNSSNVCLLLQLFPQDIENGNIRVKGLERGQGYLACIANGHIDSCSFYTHSSSETLALESNCINLITPFEDSTPLAIEVIILPCAVVIFLVFLAAILYLHRRTLLLQMCLHILRCRCCKHCRTKYRLKQSRLNRCERRPKREVSGDFLMPEDIPVDFEEFEAENNMSSPIYSCDATFSMQSNTLLSESRSLPCTPYAFNMDGKDTDFLYENQNLISPIYSPQGHNVMKLAFLEDDLGPDYSTQQCSQYLEHMEPCNETFAYLSQPKDTSSYIGSKAERLDSKQKALCQKSVYRQDYRSQPDINTLPYSEPITHFTSPFMPSTQSFLPKITARHQRPLSFSCYGSRHTGFLPTSFNETLTSNQQDADLFHRPRGAISTGFSLTSKSIHVNTLSTGKDISPEIEYSDASGDYRYPPLSDLGEYHFDQNRWKPRIRHSHSFIGHNVDYRHPKLSKSARYNRPFSLPANHAIQMPFLISPVKNQPSVYANHHPIFYNNSARPPTNNLLSLNMPHRNKYRHSLDRGGIDSQLSLNRQNFNIAPFSSSQQNLETGQEETNQIPRDPSQDQMFLPNTLPRSLKPKFSQHRVTFDSDSAYTDHFASNTLPRAHKSKLSVPLNSPRRPEHLSLRTNALSLFPQPKQFLLGSCHPPEVDPGTHQKPMPSIRKLSDGSLSTSGSSSKSSKGKPVKSLISHFENNIFFRKTPRPTKTKDDQQEFLDLQSPLAEERMEGRTKRHKVGKKKSRSSSFKKNTRKDFTSLADNSFKCFFEKDNGEPTQGNGEYKPVPITLTVLSTCEEPLNKSDTEADSAISITKSVSRSTGQCPVFASNNSISCFAEDAINLVTPFLTEEASSSHDDDEEDTYNDVLSIQASSETLRTEYEGETQCGANGNSKTDNMQAEQYSVECLESEMQPLQQFKSDLGYENAEPKEWEIML